MKAFLVTLTVAVALCLSVSSVMLSNRIATLEEQLEGLRREQRDETRKRTEEVASIGGDLATLRGHLSDLQRKHDEGARENAEKLAVIDRDLLQLREQFQSRESANNGHLVTIDQRVAEQKEQLAAQKGQLEIVRVQCAQHGTTLQSLKADVTRDAKSALTQQIVKSATDLTVRSMIDDKSLIKDQAFLAAICKILATDFRVQLRGPAGANADNTVVAGMLSKDPGFLDSVSVSVLLQNQADGEKTKQK